MIYLDAAATSLQKPSAVGFAMLDAMRAMTSPGRGGHRPSMLAAETVYRCRELAAELFHMDRPEHVVFTMNATHALNLAIWSLARKGSTAVISGFEHNSVTRPLHALDCKIRVSGRKLFDPEDSIRSFASALPGAHLAVCTVVSNVFGYILPVEEIAALCNRFSVPLILDASQAAGVLDLDFDALGAAFMAMPGHKGLLGPQGTGLLLCRDAAKPLLFGGSGSESRLQAMPEELPDRLEAGTHNVCGIAGLKAGLEWVLSRGPNTILREEQALLQIALEELKQAECELFSARGRHQSGVLSLRSPRIDCETLASRLNEHAICVRSGLHCAPLAHESAGTLETGTLRMSFSPYLSGKDLRRACQVLTDLLSKPSLS